MKEIDPRLLDLLYAGAIDPAAFERALAMVCEAFGCRSAALVSLAGGNPAADVAISVGVFDDEARASYRRDFAPLDPAPAAFSAMASGTASTTDRLLPDDVRRRSVFVHEFYRPLGLVETLGANLGPAGHLELLGLHRGNDRLPFDDGELAAVERLVPHVARALQVRRACLGLQARAAMLQAAVDRLKAGIAVIDPSGAVLHVNPALEAVARRGDGLALDRNGYPVPVSPEARRRLDRAIASVRAGGPGGGVAVPRLSGRRPYAVLVAPAPFPLAAAFHAAPDGGGALVIVHDPDGSAPSDSEILRQALGLTPAVARLVATLCADGDLKSFAAGEGVSLNTARFHLRAALARTGARTQTDLVRLAVRLLRDLDL